MGMIERVAEAMDEADLGYSIQLVKLVDGVSTYELRDSDRGDSLFYSSHAEAADAIATKRRLVKARAVIGAMREPSVDMVAAFWRQKNNGTQEIGETGDDRSDYAAWRAAIDTQLKERT